MNNDVAYHCYMCNAPVPVNHPNTVLVSMEQYLPEELCSGDPAIDFSHSFDICALCFQAILLPFIRSNSFDNYHGNNLIGETVTGCHQLQGNWTHGMYFFEDEDILKNLTTNVSYE